MLHGTAAVPRFYEEWHKGMLKVADSFLTPVAGHASRTLNGTFTYITHFSSGQYPDSR